ncbi:MAG TPA: hypothetical protein PLZ92_12420 [Phycicoccus sp.]|nr:hypothetical protein [Phycicoccus sp.]
MAGWGHSIVPWSPGPFVAYAGGSAGLERLASGEDEAGITSEAAMLDLVVRLGVSDLQGLREVVRSGPAPNWYTAGRTRYQLYDWMITGNPARNYCPPESGYHRNRVLLRFSDSPLMPGEHVVFTDALIEETLRRLGSVSELLSTPSRADGTLEVGVLAGRVKRAQEVGYARLDLVQALLRLGPVGAGDVPLFDGLVLPPVGEVVSAAPPTVEGAPGPGGGEVDGSRGPDGVDVIVGWIRGGGWATRDVRRGVKVPVTSALRRPLPSELADLPGLRVMSMAAHEPHGIPVSTFGSAASWLGVCPWDVEQLGAILSQDIGEYLAVGQARELAVLAGAAGTIGMAMTHHLARVLVHPKPENRLLAAELVAELARQGRLDPSLLWERSVALFTAGELPLRRAADAWTDVALASSWSVVWPAWRAVLDAACKAEKRSTDLAAFLEATRLVVPLNDPDAPHGAGSALPESVGALAEEGGRSKAVTAARGLLDAVG